MFGSKSNTDALKRDLDALRASVVQKDEEIAKLKAELDVMKEKCKDLQDEKLLIEAMECLSAGALSCIKDVQSDIEKNIEMNLICI